MTEQVSACETEVTEAAHGDVGPNAEAVIAALRDELARTTAELEDRERRTRQIINTANDAFFTTDIGCRITEWNNTAEQLFGYRADEVMGQQLDRFITPAGGAVDPVNPLSGILAACGENNRGELIAHHRNGHSFAVEVSISMMVDEDRFIFNAFVHDISDRQQLQQQLVQSQKLESIGQLAAGIAHEINTPTQYVGDNVEFLRDSFEGIATIISKQETLLRALRADGVAETLPDAVREALAGLEAACETADLEFVLEETPDALKQAGEGVERVATIVRSMKQFSHPGGSAMSAVDLNASVESTLTVCRGEWKYVANVETDFDAALPPVTCMPGEINQVVLNIVVNAAQAFAEQGRGEGRLGTIRVSTRADGDTVELRIVDDAGGIPEHVQPRIFDPFFTTKEVGKGTGQGLAIAHRTITQHGGTLGFESTPGRGTTFVIRLPLQPCSSAKPAPTTTGAAA